MKLIRIDSDVWKVLKQHAVPLEDNPNLVLRRLLGIDSKKNSQRKSVKRLPRGSGRTDQKAFLLPILDVLKEMGGKGTIKDVFEKLGARMKNHLKPIDFETIKSGQVRWQNTVQWAKSELTSDGLIAKNSPRGLWQITDKGKERLKVGAI